MPEALLAIGHLRVDFPDVVAVNDLSLEVCGGDVYGLIGPNGAGKTTTMRAACGLQEWTHGTVSVAGRDLARESRMARQLLGFMPDYSPVYDQLTATEFLDHFARAYGVANRAARIAECLELTWLTEKSRALCEGLSRGMKQRLLLAKTLLPDPRVLFLDEPASGLDPLGRIELRKLILQLRDGGRAILISSHILSEMSEFCNKAGIMERGRLVASGTIAELGRQIGQRRMLVKWRAAGANGLEMLKQTAGVKNVSTVDDGASFDFEGGEDALDEVLRSLIGHGVRVTEWRSMGDDLEQIFLNSGAKALM
ncbi:MAG TPA: ABC transporter ATP-binding protein [Verrucomicrobiae bacterium]|nr:ABC transporter ATP-binding protein [Verrucomicrobiae bacterium]